MTLNLFGFGVDVYQTYVGGALGVPKEYAWCIRYNYRLPKDWHCSRYFYFGWGSEPRDFWTTVKDWLRAI